jgi:XTP/dITP diphosphohydrolase
MRLVLASNNAKKLLELRALFTALPIELVPQGELGIAEAEEPHVTFIENALAKARHAARASGAAAIADDSGLCVDALGGAPGVISAHYAPAPAAAGADRETFRRAQDAANNALLLQRLRAAPTAAPPSSARWSHCAMPTTPSRWWRSGAGRARSCPRPGAMAASATTR